jgi:ADP-ribosyl-[dinitrogen reductase] hydrolase
MLEKIKGALFGLATGDALGVPVEFRSRELLTQRPVTGMTGYGTWNQPPGTWSDDSSLAFCLAESLTNGYNISDIAAKFVQWKQSGYWGAHHHVFDIGITTSSALSRLSGGVKPAIAGGAEEGDNGNGSLMRILPLVFYTCFLPDRKRFELIQDVSSITHAHLRSVFACFFYTEMALKLMEGVTCREAYSITCESVMDFAVRENFSIDELKIFNRVLGGEIDKLPETQIHSGGYVIHTLEASLWCLLNSTDFQEATLKAVNLGGDTDTTACVTGGLAGMQYGYDGIPTDWVKQIARKDDIEQLAKQLAESFEKWKRS